MKVRYIWFFAILCFSCAGASAVKQETSPPVRETLFPQEQTPAETVEKEHFVTIVAAGDNLFQTPILEEFNITDPVSKKTGYSFLPLYEHIKQYIEKADIAFVNQETVFGPSNSVYSGYPLFNTPKEAGDALAATGFDVINHATNHALDMGETGILSTIEYWSTYPDVFCLGIFKSNEERETPFCIIEKNTIKVGFLSYTTGTNRIPFPKNKQYLVSLADRELMSKELDALRSLCDYMVVSMHWGNEYEESASPAQRELAAFLAEHNTDLILGHHPHVIQPVEQITRADSGETLCIYSLGNFVSAHAGQDKDAILGGLLFAQLKKTETGTRLDKAGLIPIITHYEESAKGRTIYPLHEYTEELAQKHGGRKRFALLNKDYYIKKAEEIFGSRLWLFNPFTN
ncbi:MAG: CapA family protein [Treponema sp.]|jgi:poly-gamma-glutamate synthesis protein (capsule biosynthesis protein)|nr:CapA family protein [Treponema sp.]